MPDFGEAFAGRTAFVTGAHGMLGSWIVRALLDRGARVVILRRDEVVGSSLQVDGLQPRCHVVRGTVTDLALVERAIAEYEVDTVFHLAAQTIVGVSNRSPISTFETNIRGTWNVLEAARLNGVPRTVVASSDKAYGPHDVLPYTEDMALQARFPYDVSKACTDLIARSYFHTFGLPVAVTRFANLYGGGDLNPSRLIPEVVRAVLAGRAPIIRSDGSPERDFLYAEDAAEAYLAICDALDTPGAPGAGEAFNAGGDAPHSVRTIAERLVALLDGAHAPEYRGTGTPAGEIDRQYVDSGKLRSLTGWAPKIGLDEGLERTAAWYRAHPEALTA